MWIRWDSTYLGQTTVGKWHIRIDKRMTLCGKDFGILETIPMEDVGGSYAKITLPKVKDTICIHCYRKLPPRVKSEFDK